MDKVTQHVFFQRNDLTIRETSLGVRFQLKGCRIEGPAGAPALPLRKIKIALPLRTRPKRLKVKIVKKNLVAQSKVFVASIQPQEDPFVYPIIA